MKNICLVLVAALSAGGCATHYVTPTGIPTATLTLSADISSYPGAVVLVQAFANDRCAASPTGTRLATFTTTAVQGKGDPHAGAARSIPAGTPFVFSYIFTRGVAPFTDTLDCAMTQSFIPAPGARYRAMFRIQSAKCMVGIVREDSADPMAVDALHPVTPVCNNIING